jgi:hypothetical protein
MPELPDVEVFGRYLDRTCKGRVIGHVAVNDLRLLSGIASGAFAAHLKGARILGPQSAAPTARATPPPPSPRSRRRRKDGRPRGMRAWRVRRPFASVEQKNSHERRTETGHRRFRQPRGAEDRQIPRAARLQRSPRRPHEGGNPWVAPRPGRYPVGHRRGVAGAGGPLSALAARKEGVALGRRLPPNLINIRQGGSSQPRHKRSSISTRFASGPIAGARRRCGPRSHMAVPLLAS